MGTPRLGQPDSLLEAMSYSVMATGKRLRPIQTVLAAEACENLLNSGKCPEGDILIFMPGAYEISRTLNALRHGSATAGFALHALHGELPMVQKGGIS